MEDIKDLFVENTEHYEQEFKHKDKNKIGQFFTNWKISNFMGSLIKSDKSNLRILDPGAGTGILTLACCHNLDISIVKNVHVDLFESDLDVLSILDKNMKSLKIYLEKKDVTFTYSILNNDFILFNKELWDKKVLLKEEQYDIVISNPPYIQIKKNSVHAQCMQDIVYGKPNMYYLFMALSIHLTSNDGQAIVIVPRSFTNGVYFKKFRTWMLENSYITYIHLFESRTKLFKKNNVLQELVVLKFQKKIVKDIVISTSTDYTFSDTEKFSMDYSNLVSSKNDNKFIRIPLNKNELKLLKQFSNFNYNVTNFGLKFSTGKVVPFRAKELINNFNKDHTLLVEAKHLNEKPINFRAENFSTIEISKKSKNVLNKISNILLIKRTSSKESNRRLNLSIVLEDNCTYSYIGIENHINYLNGTSDLNIIYGIYVLLNSSYYDNYIRITNGSTQINATDLNNLPLPNIKIIKIIGNEYKKKYIQFDKTEYFETLVEKYIFNN